MHWASPGHLTIAALLLWTGCGAEVSEDPAATSGGEGGAGGDAGVGGQPSAAGGLGGAGAMATGGDGGAPLCDDFGHPCTSCLATSELCQQGYCDCLAFAPCALFWQCASSCMGDADCLDTCEMNHPGGYAEFFGVLGCMGEDCSASCNDATPLGGCFDCTLVECEDELEGCIADATCNAYLDCAVGCTDLGCQADCYTAQPDAALADALIACRADTCSDEGECEGPRCQSFGDPCTQCAFDSPACNGAYCECFEDEACGDLSQCYGSCSTGDEACADACELASADGLAEYLSSLACMGDACSEACGFDGLEPCPICLAAACENELEACVGDADCNEYLDCAGACGNPACQLACYAALGNTALADALGGCLSSECSGSCGS